MVPQSVANVFKEREEKVLREILRRKFLFIEIGIFGSYARGDYKAISDIDFLVIVDDVDGVSRDIICDLYCEAAELKADVRLVSKDYFDNDKSAFARALRRDYRRLVKYEDRERLLLNRNE